jgi:uncharacterized protein YjdB
LVITISNQVIPVTSITVTGAGGSSLITTDNGTLQLTATVSPTNATDKTVTWSVINGTGQATISSTGLVTAVSNGTVTARAAANDGSGIYGELEVSLTNQKVPVTKIEVKPKRKSTAITTVGGTLELKAIVYPEDATDQTITWSILNNDGQAIIDEKGLVTGNSAGSVVAIATANDGSGASGELTIQVILVESIKIRYDRNNLTVLVPDHLLPSKASLHNLYGTHIETKVADSNECIFDISGLPAGLYVVSVYNSVVQDAAKVVIGY